MSAKLPPELTLCDACGAEIHKQAPVCLKCGKVMMVNAAQSILMVAIISSAVLAGFLAAGYSIMRSISSY